MKIFNWVVKVVTFMIHIGLIAFGFYVLMMGVLFHSMFTQIFGVCVMLAAGLSIASQVSETAKGFIDGKVD